MKKRLAVILSVMAVVTQPMTIYGETYQYDRLNRLVR